MKNNSRLLKSVAEIYEWLDQQVRDNDDMSGHCDACGKCCDFDAFDHRLFVTPPELMYLAANLATALTAETAESVEKKEKNKDKIRRSNNAANLGDEKLKAMPTSRCPYQLDGKCTVYEYRFAGCRIFCCNGDADFQSRLSESVHKKLKSTCTEFQVPYHYAALATSLKTISKLSALQQAPDRL